VLHEFLPASEILRVAEAVVRVFARLGDYQHKQRNRMKFMIKTLGWTRWREEYDRELTACRLRGQVPTLEIDPPAGEEKPDWVKDSSPSAGHIASRVTNGRISGPGLTPTIVPLIEAGDESYARWRITNVLAQKQFGFVMAVASVPLGDVSSEQMRVLGDLARAYSDGTIRVTPDQDLVFRWVNACDVRQLYRRLAAAGLGLSEAGTVADVTSCPGAETCRLAVTQSRGLGRLLEDHLRQRPDLIASADGARIKISGCPNGCGLHHIATIGFQGSVRRLGSRAVPQYFVTVGGGAQPRGVTFGRLAAKVPARRMPEVVERLIDLYAREKQPDETAAAYFGRVDLDVVKTLLADLERLQADDAVPLDFVDLGEIREFVPEVLDGECSA
jgi:sulfite reductase (NADPH) hemoprotein beta-component